MRIRTRGSGVILLMGIGKKGIKKQKWRVSVYNGTVEEGCFLWDVMWGKK